LIEAQDLLRRLARSFPTYTAWADRVADVGQLTGYLSTVFGWTLRTENTLRSTTLNFPMQANGAEMLRLACCLATEVGIHVCAPVHDAVLIEGDASQIPQSDAEPGLLLESIRGLQRQLRAIKWPKSRPADDMTDNDSSVKDETGASEAATDVDDSDDDDQPRTARRRISWSRMIALAVPPGLALLLTLTAGYLKWQDASAREAPTARAASIQAATESTIALLSYRPDTVAEGP
jgi:hypothetical protein